MDTVTTTFTRADYMRLPEGFPAQLVDGWLVKEPAPTVSHQTIQMRLAAHLLRAAAPDRALVGPVDVGIDDLNVFQPDLVLLDRPVWGRTSDVGIPLVVIEVLSPSTHVRDRTVKKDRYLAAGVREVWLVDPARETVEVHDREGVRSAEGPNEIRSRVLETFVVVPAVLFAPPR